jgi:predicted nucleic acid-binding protein
VLLAAKSRGFIMMVKPIVDDLIHQAGFRVSNQVYQEIMRLANEMCD